MRVLRCTLGDPSAKSFPWPKIKRPPTTTATTNDEQQQQSVDAAGEGAWRIEEQSKVVSEAVGAQLPRYVTMAEEQARQQMMARVQVPSYLEEEDIVIGLRSYLHLSDACGVA